MSETLENVATETANTAQAATQAEPTTKIVETTIPMGLQESLVSLTEWLLHQWDLLITPGWRQYQILILLVLLAVSYGLRRITEGLLNAWIHSLEGKPKWQLRLLVQFRRRLTLMYFVIGSWGTYAVMQAATWPSRSYIIGVFATLGLTWLVIALVSRLILNETLRRLFRWVLWSYATVSALGLMDEVLGLLDGFAFSIGGLHISLLTLIKGFILISLMLVATRIVTRAASNTLSRNKDISPSMQVLAIKTLQLSLYGMVAVIGFQSLGFDLTGLAFLSGAIGVGIGFGLQKVVSNLVSGIIILLDRSIKPGDVISLGDTFGWIDALSARYVSVVTREGLEYLIPNEDLITGQVVNWTHTDANVRLDLTFGTAYSSDPHLVRKTAIKAAASVPRVLSGPKYLPVCHITGFGDSSVDYVLRFWISDAVGGLTNVRGDIYLALWDAFKAQGIAIPFPQREVRVLNNRLEVDMYQTDQAGKEFSDQ